MRSYGVPSFGLLAVSLVGTLLVIGCSEESDSTSPVDEMSHEVVGSDAGAASDATASDGPHYPPGINPAWAAELKALTANAAASSAATPFSCSLWTKTASGLVLQGTEVKSLRGGQATLQQAYAELRDGEGWLLGLHVPEYTEGNRANHEPDRPRKLLLHRKEIERLATGVAEKGFTVVPTKLYFKAGKVKVELALAKGKELRDKRRDIAARDAKRQIERELKSIRR